MAINYLCYLSKGALERDISGEILNESERSAKERCSILMKMTPDKRKERDRLDDLCLGYSIDPKINQYVEDYKPDRS